MYRKEERLNLLTNWKENRCKNQASRRHIHKGSHNQQQNINNKQNDISVVTDSKHSLRNRSRNACKCHYPAHNTGNAYQENNNSSHFRTVQKDFRKLRRLNRFIKENRQYHTVHNCYNTSLCCCKNTGNNASNNHNYHKQTGNCLQKYLHFFT